MKSENEVAQLCPTLSDPMDCMRLQDVVIFLLVRAYLSATGLGRTRRQAHALEAAVPVVGH